MDTDDQGRATVQVGGRRFTIPYPGRHLAANALLAWTVAEELGLDLDACARALDALVLPGGRSELRQEGGLTILNDCYNANPPSFLAAIATARELRRGRRLVFVAGSMRELGAEAPRLHARIAEALVALDPDLLAAVGDFVPGAPAARRGARLAPDHRARRRGDRTAGRGTPGGRRGRGAEGIPRRGARTYTSAPARARAPVLTEV